MMLARDLLTYLFQKLISNFLSFGFRAVTLLALEHPCKSRVKLLQLFQITTNTSKIWLFFIIDLSNDEEIISLAYRMLRIFDCVKQTL